MLISAIFGLACVAALVFAVAFRRAYGRNDAVIVSCLLCLAWAIPKFIAHGADLPHLLDASGDWDMARQVYPAVDAVTLSVVGLLFLARLEVWKLAMVLLYTGGLAVHFLYAIAAPTDVTTKNEYILFVNVTFAVKLLLTCWPGGRVIADHYRGVGVSGRRGRFGDLPAYGRDDD